MPINTPQILQTVTNIPLPMMLEKLGVAIANAQAALDSNSIRMASQMSTTNIDLGGKEYNLLSLGFTPSFYAFTEATLEIRMEISIAESEDFGGSLDLQLGNGGSNNNSEESTNTGMFGLSFTGHYAKKFSIEAESSSSIAARIVALPPPDTYLEILKSTLISTDD